MWRRRFAAGGADVLTHDAPGRGRKRQITAAREQQVVDATLHTEPPRATHWSLKKVLREQVGRSLRYIETSMFGPEYRDNGRAGTMTHDYKRHGTTTLFAALNVLEGTVIGSCLARHRHQEFRKFLNLLDAETPPDVEIHAIVDNYATHKHPAIQRWLRRHPRFHLHFVPTSASWLNLVEVWFSHLTTEQVRRGDFLSVPDLIDAIYAYIHNHNQHAVPFIWTAPAERILEKVMKCRAVSESLH